MKIAADVLTGRHVRLEPIAETHREGLRAAASDDSLWTYMPIKAVGEAFDDWFDGSRGMQERGEEIVFTVIRLDDDRIVGSTRFLALAPTHERLEIGHTFYARDVWGTVVNPECKFLLLEYAFGAMGANRVELKCDPANARSRAAIAKLGATFEGILREHLILPSGRKRDSAMFSILKRDWPEVSQGLEARLAVH